MLTPQDLVQLACAAPPMPLDFKITPPWMRPEPIHPGDNKDPNDRTAIYAHSEAVFKYNHDHEIWRSELASQRQAYWASMWAFGVQQGIKQDFPSLWKLVSDKKEAK